MKILVTGGCGYVGSVLVPLLLENHEVTVVDIQWFGNYLEEHRNLTILRYDIRNLGDLNGAEAVIHLASVADDPTSELNHEQTWEIGALGTQRLCQLAKKSGVKQFIHASSGSVYGVRPEERVTEDLELNPTSYYNKVKMVAERVALSYKDDFAVQIVRPASICGFSPRMRLEVTVNQYTIQGLENKKINVMGGQQIHPNAHIGDVADLYKFLLEHPEHTGVFNTATENIKKLEIAKKVSEKTGAEIVIHETKDARSYRMDDEKIRSIGFSPRRNVEKAISDLCWAHAVAGLKNEDRWYNLKTMSR